LGAKGTKSLEKCKINPSFFRKRGFWQPLTILTQLRRNADVQGIWRWRGFPCNLKWTSS